MRKAWLVVAVALWVGAGAALAQAPPDIFDRLRPERLAAKHADVVKYAAARRQLAPPQGLSDVRAVIHVHSHLSHDSRGTLEDILPAAKATNTRVVMMSDHPSQQLDWYRDGYQGSHEGVLFIPGAETRGFLIYPRAPLDAAAPATDQALVDAVLATGGLVFVSHPEGRGEADWGLCGVTGMEVYNHHYDRVNCPEMRELEEAMTERPVATEDATRRMLLLAEALKQYPQETFAFVQDHLAEYLRWYDRESQKQHLTAISANDTHAHWGVTVKVGEDGKLISQGPLGNPMAALDREKLGGLVPAGAAPGQVVFSLLLDSYERSFRHTSTHLLVPRLDQEAVLGALRAGHAYVAFDWIADPTGFSFQASRRLRLASRAQAGSRPALMGDKTRLRPGLRLVAALPLPAELRLYRNGERVPLPAARQDQLAYPVTEKGLYRLEAWLPVGDETYPWIYSNPIHVW